MKRSKTGYAIYGRGLIDHLTDVMEDPIKYGFGLKWYQKLWRRIKKS